MEPRQAGDERGRGVVTLGARVAAGFWIGRGLDLGRVCWRWGVGGVGGVGELGRGKRTQ